MKTLARSTALFIWLALSLSVAEVRATATAENAFVSASEDSPATIGLSSAIGGVSPQITAALSSGSGTVSITSSDTILYTPGSNFFGVEYIEFEVTDTDDSTTAIGIVRVTVTAVNDAPVAVADTATVAEDATATVISVTANDTDTETAAGSLVVTAATTAGTGTVSVTGTDGNVTYTPAADFNGTETITYTVQDADGGSDVTGTLVVTVTAVNDDPVAVADTETVAEDATATVISVTANDTDAETAAVSLVVTAATTSGTGTVSGCCTDGNVTYTPAADFNGTEVVTYTVSDGDGGSDSASLTITVSSDNDLPVAVADTLSVTNTDHAGNANRAPTTPVVISVTANDTDTETAAGSLVVTAATTSGTGTVSVTGTDGNVTYTPAADFNGTETITYTVQDADGGTDATGTLVVTVIFTNTAVEDVATTPANTSVSIAVLDNDVKELPTDVLSIVSVTRPANGTVAISGTSVIYTPDTDFSGDDTFTYQSTDTRGNTSTGSVTVTTTVANVGSCSTSASTLAAVANGCSITPSSFRTNVFAFGLCSAAPVRPGVGSSYDLSNCQLLYDGRSGAGTAITFGAVNTSYAFPDFTAPTNGSYTHGVLIIGNTFRARGLLALAGTTCVTKTASPFIDCDPAHTANNAEFTPASPIKYFYSPATYRYTFTTDSVTADLIDANRRLIADDGATTHQILAIQQFGSAKTISDATRTIDIGFRVSQALTINSSAATTAPFSIRFEVQ